MSEKFTQTEKTKIKRQPKRGSYERDTVYKILDEGFVCHIGFVVDDQPFVIPTGYARRGDELLIHGSSASRMMRALAWEKDVCASVTLIDGLVLARSAFHHSMNYRSVIIFGRAKTINCDEEKLKALEAFTEHIAAGRWSEIRLPNEKELKATTVLSLPLREASAKIRTGGPVDDAEDYELDIWAGVIPLKLTAGEAIADEKLKENIAVSKSVAGYKG